MIVSKQISIHVHIKSVLLLKTNKKTKLYILALHKKTVSVKNFLQTITEVKKRKNTLMHPIKTKKKIKLLLLRPKLQTKKQKNINTTKIIMHTIASFSPWLSPHSPIFPFFYFSSFLN